MAKKEWRLDVDSKNDMVSDMQAFLSERDPSIPASEWYKRDLPENYARTAQYSQVLRTLPSRIVKDIEHFVSEAAKLTLKNREDEVTRREEASKKHAEDDRKRDADLAKREHELEEKVRGKEAALALGEAEIARMKAQVQAEAAIYQSKDFRTHGPMMMTPWGPLFGRY